MAESKEVKKETKATTSDVDSLKEMFDNADAAGGKKKRRRGPRKIFVDLKCPLCEGGVKMISYKDVYQLKKYTSVRGKIIGREKSGMCARHQRQLSRSIKRARYMALMPYVSLSE